MALYWHPFFAEMLRQTYGDRLIIQETVTLGDMPLEADLLLIRRDPQQPLPFPFQFLGQQTLVEYKSPDETGDQAALHQLQTYAMLWLQRNGLPPRRSLTLWLVASRISPNVSDRTGAKLVRQKERGPGVISGTLDGFPIFLVDLQRVPFSPDTLALHLASRGAQEQSLVEYVIDHRQNLPQVVQMVQRFHGRMLLEVLHMRHMTPEQMGIDYEALLELIGKERAINLIDKEQIIDVIGEEELERLLERRRRNRNPRTDTPPPRSPSS